MTWCAQRMKHLVNINVRDLPEDTSPAYEFRYIDITAVGRGLLAGQPARISFGDAPSRARRIVQRGDTIVSTVRTYLRAVLTIRGDEDDLVASTGFAVLTPGSSLEARYLGWWAQSAPFVEEIVSRSVGVSYPAINAAEIGDLRMPVPPLAVQRAIADYLDAETARIDALIARKRRMIALLEERRQCWVEAALQQLAMRTAAIPMKHATSAITVGIVVTPSEWYAPAGVPALRGLNVRPGRIVLDEMVYITPEGHQLHAKSALSPGDVVTVRTGQAGATAVVPAELAGANCIDLLITRPSERALPEFLSLVLNSGWAAKHVDEGSVGAIQSHFNVGSLRELPIPLPEVREQAALLHEADLERQHMDSMSNALTRQIALLAEHRQALITAAVTGALAAPGVTA